MSNNIGKHIFYALLVFLAQILLFRHLRIFGAEADFILLYIIWLMSQRDRTSVLLFAGILGFAQDALLDLWGLNMFAKVAITMLCYNLVPDAEETLPVVARIALIILSITLIHNVILMTIAAFVGSLSFTATFTIVLLGNTIFTTFAGAFLYIFRNE
jgi:rod shape-determining protein MreD